MKQLVIIAGPTASGKTALSVVLALHYHSEIISADSRQFYRQMKVGTAKPSARELSLVPHHFIDSLDITENYNAGRFENDALKITDHLFQKHDILFMTGGSGLYINALCNGIDELPEAPPEIREELNGILKNEGIETLRKKLFELDPEYYSETDLNNPHRILRAIEVTMIAGKKFSSLRIRAKKKRNFSIKKIGLLVDRDELYESINKRVDEMFSYGLVEEAKSLLPFRHANALQTVGYKEVFDYLDNMTSLQETIALVKQNTRHYAKRQMTWFRKDPDIRWFYPAEKEKMIDFIDSPV